MAYAIFDIESTGLSNKDEVIQFGCVLTDNTFKIKNIINFYCYTQQPIHPQALAVHHLDKATLLELSGGKTFEDNFYEMLRNLNEPDLTWVHWSTSDYDIRAVNNTLTNNGLPAYNFGKKLPRPVTMPGVNHYNLLTPLCGMLYGHPKKLGAAVQDLPFSSEDIESIYQQQIRPSGTADVLAHNALYDAYCTWMLLYAHKNELRA